MNITQLLLFLIGCIGMRSLFVYIAYSISNTYLPYLGYLGLLPAIGFIIIYMFDLRKTGPEVFGERIWWNDLRPVHAAMYMLFSISAINKKSYAWTFLLADVTIGLISFLVHHYG
jgi:hypothetical protein